MYTYNTHNTSKYTKTHIKIVIARFKNTSKHRQNHQKHIVHIVHPHPCCPVHQSNTHQNTIISLRVLTCHQNYQHHNAPLMYIKTQNSTNLTSTTCTHNTKHSQKSSKHTSILVSARFKNASKNHQKIIKTHNMYMQLTQHKTPFANL